MPLPQRADKISTARIEADLAGFIRDIRPLPGIRGPVRRTHFALLLTEEARKILGTIALPGQVMLKSEIDPASEDFDPVKAAVFYSQNSASSEAWWILFLAAYFGRHKRSGWNLLRAVYKPGNPPEYWQWHHVSLHKEAFNLWLIDHQPILRSKGQFGEQHKHAVLDPHKAITTATEISSFIDWINNAGGFNEMVARAILRAGDDPRTLFDVIFHSINSVGRTVKINFLSLAGQIGLAKIEPAYAYLHLALQPKKHARLLFESRDAGITTERLNQYITALADYLDLPFGILVLQNALIRFQKEKQ